MRSSHRCGGSFSKPCHTGAGASAEAASFLAPIITLASGAGLETGATAFDATLRSAAPGAFAARSSAGVAACGAAARCSAGLGASRNGCGCFRAAAFGALADPAPCDAIGPVIPLVALSDILPKEAEASSAREGASRGAERDGAGAAPGERGRAISDTAGADGAGSATGGWAGADAGACMSCSPPSSLTTVTRLTLNTTTAAIETGTCHRLSA